MKTEKDARRFALAVAKNRGWQVNSDDSLVMPVLEGLASNFNTYGYFQCPCRDSWGTRDKDKDIICPCAYAQADIHEYGQCYCGLFVSDAFVRSGREADAIPERRPDELYP
ncbi:MAG: ferredoxin:thioredoxin reductase [Spirochaetales bacterium]|nr:ferredoxin:thioredoxin reductase [Spirochaetales bacterium]